MEELDREGVIEPQPLGELGALRDRGFLTDHVGDRITDEAEHRERQQRDREHHHHGLGEAAQDVGDHWRVPAMALSPSS